MLVAVSLLMLASSNRRRLEPQDSLARRLLPIHLAIIVGGISALLGLGGGTLMLPLLTLCTHPIHRAVSTASVFGFIISAPATLVSIGNSWNTANLPAFNTGYVNELIFAILVPISIWLAPLRFNLADEVNIPHLKQAFALLLFLLIFCFCSV